MVSFLYLFISFVLYCVSSLCCLKQCVVISVGIYLSRAFYIPLVRPFVISLWLSFFMYVFLSLCSSFFMYSLFIYVFVSFVRYFSLYLFLSLFIYFVSYV